MAIEITIEPVEIVVDGTSILFQGDPSATAAWSNLLEMKVTYSDPAQRDQMRQGLVDALATLTETGQDTELLTKLDPARVGVATLKRVAEGYIQAVTGFPTVPSKRSTKR